MGGVGIREVVALGVLGIAAFFAFLFFDPRATESKQDVPARFQGEVSTPAEGLSDWSISYYEGEPASGRVAWQGIQKELAPSFERGPFPDVADNDWGVSARAVFGGESGRYLLDITWAGEIAVVINGTDHAVSPASGPRALVIPFLHEADAPTTISIRLQDTEGPLALQVVVRH